MFNFLMVFKFDPNTIDFIFMKCKPKSDNNRYILKNDLFILGING